MRNIFIDCGGNKGQALRAFIEKYNIDKNWLIQTYEPNPLCDLHENIKDLTSKYNIEIFNCAVFDFTGKIKFSQMLEDDQGSSVNCLMSNGACSNIESPSFRKHDSIIEVDCIDICEVIKDYNHNDNLIIKLDIEGSEFNVLRKLIKTNTISKIKHLYVEWHTPFVRDENENTENELKNEIINKGIQLYEWH